MMKYPSYTGVGSRKTPREILVEMQKIAMVQAGRGMILRSGGAVGADSWFLHAAQAANGPPSEIYRPEDVTDEALEMAEAVHPAWHRCNHYARLLHARNCFQVLGRNLDHPSKFVVCWTPDGAETEAECSIRTGGTGTAIRLADRNGIRVYNLAKPGSQTELAFYEA